MGILATHDKPQLFYEYKNWISRFDHLMIETFYWDLLNSNSLMLWEKKTTFRCIAEFRSCNAWYAKLVNNYSHEEKESGNGEITPWFLRMPFVSLVISQPSLQPGTIHLFDIDPTVTIGAIDPKIPIGTKGLFPKVRWS